MSNITVITEGYTAQRCIISTGANTGEPAWIVHGPRNNGVQENTAVFANSEYMIDRLIFSYLENKYVDDQK